ncbi:hypothetical protein G6F46_015560 [Rhizopus delemar]|nr:hypothetical protein G6F46_015560 [Rhizopus delemar]
MPSTVFGLTFPNPVGLAAGLAGGAAQVHAQDQQHWHQERHAGHLDDGGDFGGGGVDIAGGADDLRHFMDGAADVDAKRLGVEIKPASVVQDGV